MNKMRILLTWGLLLAVTYVMGYTITVDPITIVSGQNTNLIIKLNNTETNLTAYQMSLYLPEGVTVQKKSNGKYAYTANGSRHDGQFTFSVQDAADGSVLIACFSADMDVLTGTSGELIRIPLDVASTVTTSLQGSLKRIEFSDVNENGTEIPDVYFDLIMGSGSNPGDNPGSGSASDADTDISKLIDAIYVNPMTSMLLRGKEATINISLKNANSASGYSFDLLLPECVSLVEDGESQDGDDVNYNFQLSSRHNGHSAVVNYKEASGVYSFVIYSMTSKNLRENDGIILTLHLKVADNVEEGDYPIKIQNAKYSPSSGTATIVMPETKSTLTIEHYARGDANGDGEVDVSDIICVVRHLVGKTTPAFFPKAADANCSGDVDIADVISIVNIVMNKD